MKKLILIFIIIILVGCAPVKPVTQNFPSWTLTQNQRHAYTYQEKLAGMQQDEVLDRFGVPQPQWIFSPLHPGIPRPVFL